MKKILCKVEYLGENFFGWQVQNAKNKNLRTVEGELINALEKILKEKVSLFVSGRTDALVSAKGQRFHFETSKKVGLNNLLIALRSLLPKDISVTEAKYVEENFDARYSAKEKQYHYRCYVSNFVDVFLEKQYVRLSPQINVVKMKKAAKLFKGKNNFNAYYKKTKNTNYNIESYNQAKKDILENKFLSKKEKQRLLYIARKKHTPIRKITMFKIVKKSNKIVFKIRGDGFLHNMARIIAGTVIEVGMGKRTLNQVKLSLTDKPRDFAGKTMDAKGLVLWDVKY